jgi:hypothetical protein
MCWASTAFIASSRQSCSVPDPSGVATSMLKVDMSASTTRWPRRASSASAVDLPVPDIPVIRTRVIPSKLPRPLGLTSHGLPQSQGGGGTHAVEHSAQGSACDTRCRLRRLANCGQDLLVRATAVKVSRPAAVASAAAACRCCLAALWRPPACSASAAERCAAAALRRASRARWCARTLRACSDSAAGPGRARSGDWSRLRGISPRG